MGQIHSRNFIHLFQIANVVLIFRCICELLLFALLICSRLRNYGDLKILYEADDFRYQCLNVWVNSKTFVFDKLILLNIIIDI